MSEVRMSWHNVYVLQTCMRGNYHEKQTIYSKEKQHEALLVRRCL